MPEKKTIERARKDAQEGKAPSTQAGEFVREEIEHVREGKHGARSPKQAIAIGLSKARKAGIKLPPQPGKKAKSTSSKSPKHSQRRAKATLAALKREPKDTVFHSALAKQTHQSAIQRGSKARHEAAEKAVRTKGKSGLRRAARKAAHTREFHAH